MIDGILSFTENRYVKKATALWKYAVFGWGIVNDLILYTFGVIFIDKVLHIANNYINGTHEAT